MLRLFLKIFILIMFVSPSYGCGGEIKYTIRDDVLTLKQKFIEGGLELSAYYKNKEIKFMDSIFVLSEDKLFAFICPMNNGNWPEKPFSILDLTNWKITNLDIGYVPMDEISCSISTDSEYYQILDEFKNKKIVFTRLGSLPTQIDIPIKFSSRIKFGSCKL